MMFGTEAKDQKVHEMTPGSKLGWGRSRRTTSEEKRADIEEQDNILKLFKKR